MTNNNYEKKNRFSLETISARPKAWGGTVISHDEEGNPVYAEDWSDKVEPWASGIGLAADAIGLGTAATGVGVPVGAVIAGVGNIPNLVVDGYQTVRDWSRVYNDGAKGNIGSALWNTGETALGIFGAKLALKGAKIANDKIFAEELKGRISDEIKKREGHRHILRKKGMTDEEITKYITQKATNAATNSKDMVDAKKRSNEKFKRDANIYNSTISAINNASHLDDTINTDNTRINRPVIVERIKRKQ